MNRLLITRIGGRLLTALMDGMKAVQLDFEESGPSILGSIYVGKVRDIVKNINAAFVDLGNGVTGYYSLDANPVPLFASPKTPADVSGAGKSAADIVGTGRDAADIDSTGRDAAGSDGTVPNAPALAAVRPLRPGDEIIVQVARDAVKTKDPVLTSCLSFTGRYCVLTSGRSASRSRIAFSAKIKDAEWKKQMEKLLAPEKDADFGLIVRTNAYEADPEQVAAEALRLKEQYRRVLKIAANRICFSLLYADAPSYVARIRDTYTDAMDEILTDDADIYAEIRTYLEKEQPQNVGKLRLYTDPMISLAGLYSLEKSLQEALQKKVWLKSGGYLVIEPTEAMTVIDVNTGKFTGKKIMRDTIRMINLEAAREIAVQLRLRNLSGIILVDFINMEEAEDRKELMKTLADCCGKDPVKTTVVDMTKLNLVELTRKKIRKPLYEQWK